MEHRTAPGWMKKHPCEACGTGYGMCAQGLSHSLMCCKGCSHPGRWQPDPWTAAEYAEMWEGRMGDFERRNLQRLIEKERRESEVRP